MTTSEDMGPAPPAWTFRRLLAACLAVAAACVVVLAGPASASAGLVWRGPVAPDIGLTGSALTTVACASTSTCTALTSAGGAVSFNPGSPAPGTAVAVAPSVPLAVACPSASLCVAVDGAGNAISYNPAAPAGATVHAIDAGHVPDAVTCLSTSTCVAVDTSGYAVTFSPTGSPGPVSHAVDAGQFITAVSCPGSGECVTVDAADTEVTFDPANGQTSPPQTLKDYSGTASSLNALACVSATQCETFDGNGYEIQFNPQGNGLTIVPLDKGHAIELATCPTSGQCTVLDTAGDELTFQPGTTTPPPGTPGSSPGRPAQPVPVAPSGQVSGLACASSSRCVVVTGQGQVIGFDPVSEAIAAPVVADAGIGAYAAIACASAAQCTGADQQGDALTFDPQTGAARPPAAVDPGAVTVYGEACPAVTQCTLVDANGNEVTFDPQSPGAPSAKQLVVNHPLLAIACPAATQCTALTDDRDEITFNPQSPATATYASLDTPAGDALTGIACPLDSQCTAVDGSGQAVTFDPQAPGRPVPVAVLPGAAVAVACPSAQECVAADARGHRATFNPASPGGATTALIDRHRLEAVQCITATYCVALDAASDAVEFDPHAPGATATTTIAPAAVLAGLACRTSDECVAVDHAGAAFVATGTLPAPPVNGGPPSVSGRAREGARLTARPGTWLPAPTSFATQWQRCTAAGRGCRPIAGATSPTYRPVAADVGHRLRVSERACDQSGYAAAAAVSRPSGRIAATPAPPAISDPSISLARSGRAILQFTLTAARFGPQMRTLTVSLPRGVAFSVPRPRRAGRIPGLTVRVRRHAVTPAVHASRGGLVLTLRRAAHQLRLTLTAPGLRVSPALARRLRRRRPVRMALTVTLHVRRTRRLRVSRHWTAR